MMNASNVSLTNTPIWSSLPKESREGFQEVWFLKVNDPSSQRALWLRFLLLTSENGFRRVAETWAVVFHRKENREISKLALRQTYDIHAFSELSGGAGVRIDRCELSDTHTRGQIQYKGRSIQWDLAIQPAQASSFNFVPDALAKVGLVKNRAFSVGEDLRVSGTTKIDGETHSWNLAPAMQAHLSGPRKARSWVWGHCNTFANEQGQPVPFVFDGLSAQTAWNGPIPSPRFSTFYFRYQNQEFRFNSIWDVLRSRSNHSLTEWTFEAERGDYRFRGKMTAELRDFAGLTYEDTDGSYRYCTTSQLSDLTVWVYKRGKLDATLSSQGTAAYELISRDRNPYVPLLI